jgi:hypothetical protein
VYIPPSISQVILSRIISQVRIFLPDLSLILCFRIFDTCVIPIDIL